MEDIEKACEELLGRIKKIPLGEARSKRYAHEMLQGQISALCFLTLTIDRANKRLYWLNIVIATATALGALAATFSVLCN